MTPAPTTPPRQPSPTLTIDTESDPGSWATAIAHTPHLAAQVREADARQPAGRTGDAS